MRDMSSVFALATATAGASEFFRSCVPAGEGLEHDSPIKIAVTAQIGRTNLRKAQSK